MKNLVIFLATVLSLFFLTACHHHEDLDQRKYIHFPLKAEVTGLDPAVHSMEYISQTVLSQIYEGLYQYSYLETPLRVEPLLAASMPRELEGGRKYLIKLKPGVYFQDDPCFKNSKGKGREVLADDFIFAWKRLADPANKSMGFAALDQVKGYLQWRDQAIRTGAADYSRPIEGLKSLDGHTLLIELVRPQTLRAEQFIRISTAPMPHEAIEMYGIDILSHPVGTGPYRLKSWIRNGQVILDRNPTFRREFFPVLKGGGAGKGGYADSGKTLPLNDGVIFEVLAESSSRFFKYQSGALDVLPVPLEFVPKVLSGKERVLSDDFAMRGNEVTKMSLPVTFSLAFNMDDPIVGKNKFLRKAIAAAFDTNGFIDSFFSGLGYVAQSPIPPGLENFDPSYKNPNGGTNISKALAWLKKSGYSGGKNTPELVLDVPSSTTYRQEAEFFQQQMAAVGIKIKINMMPWTAFVDSLRLGKGQIKLDGNGYVRTDPREFFKEYYGPFRSPGPNYSNYDNPQYNTLFEKWDQSLNFNDKRRYAREMLKTVMEDLPVAPIAHEVEVWLNQGWIKNFRPNFMIVNAVKYYRINLALKKNLQQKL